jgi:hypothetical protein
MHTAWSFLHASFKSPKLNKGGGHAPDGLEQIVAPFSGCTDQRHTTHSPITLTVHIRQTPTPFTKENPNVRHYSAARQYAFGSSMPNR